MFRRCVGSQMHRLLVCPRLSPSVPPVSSAWQRYRSDGNSGIRPTLATFNFDPPMACDILTSDLTRTGRSARIRQVRQRISLVVPSRGIRFRTSSRPRKDCQVNGKDRPYHDVKNRENVDISAQDNRTIQRLRKLMEDDVSDTGNLGTKLDRNHIRVKVKRKEPLKASRNRIPKNLPSSLNSEEAEEFFDCQEPRNPIKKFITLIWEKSKEVRAQLREGKYADLKRINETKEEDQIWNYQNLYGDQIQKKISGLCSRSVDDKELQNPTIATLSQNHCPQESKPMSQGKDVFLGKEVSASSYANFNKDELACQGLKKSAVAPPPKAPLSQDQCSEDSRPRAEKKKAIGLNEEVPASSNANSSKVEKACEELGKPSSPPSLDNLRSREESLMSNAKKESIHRWQVHKRSRPFEPMSYQFPKLKQMHLDAVSQYAIRKQSQNHNQADVNVKRHLGMSLHTGPHNKISKAKKNLTDHRIYKSAVREEIQNQLKEFNCSQCKSDSKIIDKKLDLKDKKQSEHEEEILKQLKTNIHKQILNYFDHESRTLLGDKNNLDFSTYVGKLNDKDELKFRVGEMLAKCMFLVQNKMENETGGGIVYEEKDKDVARIAEDIWKHHLQNREYPASKQEVGDSLWENESKELCKEIEEILESKEAKEAEKPEEVETDNESSKEPIPKTNDGMKSKLNSSQNVENHELGVMDQIERVMDQCQRLKEQIEKRSSKSVEPNPKPEEDLNQESICGEEDQKKEGDESDRKRENANEVQESKSDEEELKIKKLETGLSNNCAEDPRGIMDIIIEALKEKYEECELREILNQNDKKYKCTQTEEEDPEEKCPEDELEMEYAGYKQKQECEETEEMEECAEGELENKNEDNELKKKCMEDDPNKRCLSKKVSEKEYATDEEKSKQAREECASLASEKTCAENENKTNKKCETDDEDDSGMYKEEESEDLDKISFDKLKKKCEEMELKKECPEELAEYKDLENKLEEKLQAMKDKIGTKEMNKSVAVELKNFCENIDRQKRCADEKLKKMREQMERTTDKGKDEFSKLTWPEGLRDISKRKTVTKVFPALNGIFRMPGFEKECLEEPLCDPVPSVGLKLNGRDYRELSLRQRKSFLYPGSTFPNPRRVPLLESNFFLRRLWPDLNPLSINNSLQVYWLRRTPPSYLPFCRRTYHE